MRAQLPASPDDIDFTVLAAAVKRGLGKLLLATGVAGLASTAVLPSIMPKHASQMQIEIVSKAHAAQFDSRRDARDPQTVSAGMDGAPIVTHLQAAKSSDLSRATELSLAATREFNSALAKLGARPSSENALPLMDMIALLAMTATLLLGLAFVVTRELFAMAQQAPTLRRAARPQASLVTSAIHSLVPDAGQSVIALRTMPPVARRPVADAQGRTGSRTPAVGEAAGFAADARVVELARRLARHGCPVSCSTRAPTALGWDQSSVYRPRSAINDALSGRASFEDAIAGLAALQCMSPPPVREWRAPPQGQGPRHA